LGNATSAVLHFVGYAASLEKNIQLNQEPFNREENSR
jgi:hypothetical protein